MGTMVRINAHVCRDQRHDEDVKHKIVFIALTTNSNIIPGTFYGEIYEYSEDYCDYISYPFKYISRNSDESKLHFGGCSYLEGMEEIYRTNLHKKTITAGEYFTVIDASEGEWTYIIDHVHKYE